MPILTWNCLRDVYSSCDPTDQGFENRQAGARHWVLCWICWYACLLSYTVMVSWSNWVSLQLLSSILVTDWSLSLFLRGNLFPWKNHQCGAVGHVRWQVRKEALHCDQHPLSVWTNFQTRCQIIPSMQFSWTGVNLALTFFRVVFNTLFGLSKSYWMAIVTRGFLGLLCGILGPIKVNLLCESLVLIINRHRIRWSWLFLHFPGLCYRGLQERAPSSWNLPCKNSPFVLLFSNLRLLQLNKFFSLKCFFFVFSVI
jgi:hypothetical protein